jgi:hypothetical protein
MASRKQYWHYVYVIYYPARNYCFYYGSRITDKPPADDWAYFGSSVSFAQYNDPEHPEYQADAIKVVLAATQSRRTKKAEQALGQQEADLIRAALRDHGLELCLNRNVQGRICLTEQQRKAALERSIANGGGFVNMSKEQQLAWASAGGRKSYTMKTGVHAIPRDKVLAALAKGRKVIAQKYAKTYVFKNPAGKTVTVCNLAKFCREQGLRACHMRGVQGGRYKSHKGWTKA